MNCVQTTVFITSQKNPTNFIVFNKSEGANIACEAENTNTASTIQTTSSTLNHQVEQLNNTTRMMPPPRSLKVSG